MLAVVIPKACWRCGENGSSDIYLRQAWEQGIVLGGVSAGSICWFEQGVTDSIPGSLTALPALGFLQGSNCPHYDGEKDRKPSYHRLMQEDTIKPGIAIDDYCAVHFIDNTIAQVIKTKPTAHAYKVWSDRDTIREERINT